MRLSNMFPGTRHRMDKWKRIFRPALMAALVLGGLVAARGPLGQALAQAGAEVNWWVFAGGGAPSTGDTVTLNDTLGQPVIDLTQGGTVALQAGYWYAAAGPMSLLGDVNADDLVDSTDALIVLSADAGLDTAQFCPMNCGDTNADGRVDSTDALIILTHDAGLPVGTFPVGQPGCPATITPPPGCTL